jgi:hypothetical protein
MTPTKWLFLLAAVTVIAVIGWKKINRETGFDIDWSQV